MGWRRRAIVAPLRRMGYDLQRRSPNLIDFLESRAVTVVFDVGANEGQYGLYLRDLGFHGRIVSFEPVKASFRILSQHAAGDELWTAHNCALGAAPGTASIHVSDATAFSSMLSRTAAADAFESSSTAYREDVDVFPLDQLVADYRLQTCFLKIDTQGFERAVLDGAKTALKSLAGVQLELPIIHLYENVWSYTEALEFMAARGFVLGQTFPVNYHPRDPGAVVDLDCVFRRARDFDVAAPAPATAY
jgi:FkbM family methyltransferase